MGSDKHHTKLSVSEVNGSVENIAAKSLVSSPIDEPPAKVIKAFKSHSENEFLSSEKDDGHIDNVFTADVEFSTSVGESSSFTVVESSIISTRNSSPIPTSLNKEDGHESPNEETVVPETPKGQIATKAVPKFIFGSAAKSLVSFTALAQTEKKADFSLAVKDEEEDSDALNVKDKNLGDKIDINTGEENEQCKFSARVKLFELALMKESAKTTVMEWKEKGSGTVRVNEEPESGSSRIIVRAEGVLRVLINVRLFKGMRFEIVQHRSVRFAAIDDKNTTSHYILRFKTVEEACNFLLECTVHCENSDEASTS